MVGRLTVHDLLKAKGRQKWLQVHVDSGAEAAAAFGAGIRVLSCEPDHTLEPIRAAAPGAFVSAGMPHGAVYGSHSPFFIETMARAGIPFTGHVGLVPNLAAWTGFRAIGKTADEALKVLARVRDLENAGAACVEIEVVPVELADHITRATAMVTIGMGCGDVCDTQYLFSSDILGANTGHDPRHSRRSANFAALESELQEKRLAAFRAFARDVATGACPGPRHEARMDPAVYDDFVKRSQTR